jgi:hypothetical protein
MQLPKTKKPNPMFQGVLNRSLMACPACNYTGGHAANCITNLQTPQQRVRRAAQLFHNYYCEAAAAHCREEKLSELEIESGRKLAKVQKEHTAYLRNIYGDPAYGSYRARPDDAERGNRAEQVVIDEHLAQLPKPIEAESTQQLLDFEDVA